MKQTLRTFSIGLFTAGIILLAIVLFDEDTSNEKASLSHKDTVEALEKDGYHVLSDKEYISLSVKSETSSEEKEKQSTKDEKKQEVPKKKEPQTFTLKIQPGLASSSISSLLEKNGIIKNADAFNKYLEDNDYSQYVQIGTFEVTDQMTFNQLAETITN
ncbi:hypothetical protein [Virgibacillus sp. DJP39]|uniref:hypothetical protein n=1 Tax=Virgibacillus sp. DJP39 TaxID=3409790 RepID=UPI003BB5B8A4